MTIWRHIIMTTKQEVVTKPESELQPIPSTTTDELSQVHQATQTLVDAVKGLAQAKIQSTQATQALVDALKGLAQANIQSATDLTEETHHSIDRSVQVLRDKADRSWQAAIHQVEDIDDRMTKAAKAAWEILTDPPSDPKA
jgi:ABC-type transporter Mla subunit MlaD